MTPPARLQPVQAWAIVDPSGSIRGLHLSESAAAMKCLDQNGWATRALGEEVEPFHVERVTVRASARPKQKTRK